MSCSDLKSHIHADLISEYGLKLFPQNFSLYLSICLPVSVTTVHRRMQNWHVSAPGSNVCILVYLVFTLRNRLRKWDSPGLPVLVAFNRNQRVYSAAMLFAVTLIHVHIPITIRPNSLNNFYYRFKGAVTWYTVDLDLPPSKRWTTLMSEKKDDVSGISF